MPIHRHVTRALGHACTIVACDATKQALVVDPGRDIAPILELARTHDLDICWVADTHGHNDYLSGLLPLSLATGAQRVGYVGMTTDWAELTPEHGARIQVGDVDVEVLHTPGHTPEHTAFLVREPGEPPALLSGGSLLVGDVGRPDLLGGDDELAAATATSARTILDVVLALDDDVRLFPTHVAGSLCAGAIGGDDECTLAVQRTTNPAVVAMVAERDGGAPWLDASTLPPVPAYWRRMRGANLAGLAAQPAPQLPPRLQARDALTLVQTGHATLVDTRTPDEHGAAHPAGATFVPAGDSFATWAGSVLDEGEPLVLVAAHDDVAARASLDAWRIGLGPVLGWLHAGDVAAWPHAGGELDHIEQVTIADAFDDETLEIIDVRSPLEHRASPIPGAWELPATLLARKPQLAPGGPITLACASGTRSMVIASVLKRAGHPDARNVRGGIAGALPVA